MANVKVFGDKQTDGQKIICPRYIDAGGIKKGKQNYEEIRVSEC